MRKWFGRHRVLLLLGASLVVLGAGSWLLAPSDVEVDRTSVLGLLLGDAWVVGALRTVAVAGLLFLLASIAARASAGEWVRRVGPVDVSSDVEAVAADGDQLQQQLDDARGTIQRLEEELEAAVALLDEVTDTRGAGDARAP